MTRVSVRLSDCRAANLKIDEHLQCLARGWLPQFRTVHEIKRACEAKGQTSRALQEQLDLTPNNLEEDLQYPFGLARS
jgi:hypothetical protein